ncbi:diaminopimelate decarboxylase [soil metagenome]
MELRNNRYFLGGVDMLKVCEEFDTPLYVYDANKIVEQLNSLKEAFSGLKLRIKFAAKSLTNIAILKLLKRNGSELDAVSIQEAYLGLKAGFSPEQILFTPNCVSFQEIQEAVELGLTINIDNLNMLEEFGKKYSSSVPCCIRINPHIMAGGNHKISTGHIDSKFGISILQLEEIKKNVELYSLKVTGLHIHTGSDFLDADAFLRGAEILFNTAKHFADLRFLDFGSGFKVAYKEGDLTTDIQELGIRLKSAFQAFCKDYGRELEIWFEPGKYIVSEAGYLLVKTNVVKTTPARVFIGVNSGLNHLIRPMMYDAYHDMVNISHTEGDVKVYTIVGYICETDTLGWDRKMHEVRAGDIIAIKNAGAYGFSMSSNYNSRLRPAEVLIIEGQAKLIRKRETMEDLVKNLVDVDI